jgi:hypothetical protein
MRGIWVPSSLLTGSLGPAEALLAGYIGGWPDGCCRLVKRGVIQKMGRNHTRKMRLSKRYAPDAIAQG